MSQSYSYELTRTVDASAARVWQAWTTPDQAAVAALAAVRFPGAVA